MKRLLLVIVVMFCACTLMGQDTQASTFTISNLNKTGVRSILADVPAAKQNVLPVLSEFFGHPVSPKAGKAQQIDCTLSLNPFVTNFSPTGGTFSFSVNTSNSACLWTAKSNNSWITITAGSSGTGNGRVTFNVEATTGPSRNATITVALTDGSNQTFLIDQLPGCTYSLNPTSAEFPINGGNGSFSVITSDPGCSWYTLQNESWVTVNSETGIGNGTVTFTVQPNNGTKRTESILVRGLAFVVIQDGSCTYSLNPNVANVPAAGGSFSFNVVTQQNCAWGASTNDTWVNIISGSGNGIGQFNFTVQANTGEARTGTIKVGNQTFTINQDSRCSYILSAVSIAVAAAGGVGSLNVTAPEGCLWTAVSNVPWITINSGASGSGGGTISFKIQSNPTGTRQGTITVNGVTFTVLQNWVPQSQPTTISGFLIIKNIFGKPVRSAMVTFKDTLTGEERTVISNPFGYASMKDIQAGQGYSIIVSHKQYRFNSFYITAYNTPFGIEFRAQP